MPLAETAKLTAQLNMKGDFNQKIGKAQRGLTGFSKKLNGVSGQAKTSLLQGFGMGAGIGAFGAFAMAAGKAVDVLSDSVRMAAEEEAAMWQLNRAIEANDDSWDGNYDAVERLIAQRQELAFSDGEQRESLQLLVGATKDYEEAANLMSTAMDFARFRGIDLKTSADLLGRAYAGNFGTLSRYGVVLEENATATEALAQIQEMAAGQADAYAESAAGQFERATIAWNDAKEDLGRVLLPVVTDLATMAAETLPDIVDAAKDSAAAMEPLVGAFGSLADAINESPLADILDTLSGAPGIIPATLGALDDEFGSHLEGIVGENTALGGIWDGIAQGVEDVQGALTDSNNTFDKGAQMMEHYRNEAAAIQPAGAAAADGIAEMAEAADWAKSRIDGLAGALEHVATTSHSDVVSSFDSMKKAVREAAKSNTWAELNKQIAWAEKRLARAGQGDTRAVLTNFIADARGQVAQRRQVSRANRGLGNTGVEGAGGPNIDFQKIIEAQRTGNTELGNTLALQLQTNAETNSTALATMSTEQATATAAAAAEQAAAIAANGATVATAISAIPAAIAAIPPPPTPLVDVDVHNNISATTVEHTTQKVVRTNRVREDTP